MYNKKTSYQNGNVAWRCADMMKYKCLASCIVNGTKLIRARTTHTHESRKATFRKKDVFLSEWELENLFSGCTTAVQKPQ